jgi:NAD(P)-dependent dehydrogenase (short-subunit alcohol dehydrogenase family)
MDGMIPTRLRDSCVLVTGGTRGLGKAIGLEFARAGAKVYLTHRWGSVDEEELVAEFRQEDLPAPRIVESDVADGDATRELMGIIKEEAGRVDVIVSNVAFSKVVKEITDLKRSTLDLSLQYSAWPVVDLIHAAHEVTGEYPRYVLGISSDGGEICHDGYDFAGVSKAVLETLCRYLALRLKRHGVRVNAVRPGFLDTASFRATFDDETADALKERVEGLFLDPGGVAQACVALCSGLMDAVTGQVIVVDEGWSLVSPLAYLTGRGLPGGFPVDGG